MREAKGRFEKGRAKTGGRKAGVVNQTTVEIREVARSLLEDPQYQRRLRERLLAGKCPPQIEALLFYYGYGKPRETVKVEESASLAGIFKAAHQLRNERDRIKKQAAS